MRPFAAQIETLVAQGYGQAAAQAKVAHDAVLLAMDVCGFKKHSTVKGGIVMSHVTNDIRRTTMDMDIAFVHRSISDTSIVRFVRICLDSLIYSNRRIQPTNKDEIIVVLKDVFASRQFIRRLASARANWLQIEPDKATAAIIRFLETL